MSFASSFAHNYGAQLLGKVVSVLLGLATVSLMTRSLEDFGEYAVIIAFLSFFGVLVDFGLNLTLTQMISVPGADEEQIVGNVFTMRLVFGALGYAIAPLAVLAFPYSSAVKLGVLVGSVAYFLMSDAWLLVGIYQKHLLASKYAAAECVSRLVYFLLVAAAAWAGMGVVTMIAGLVVANLVWLIWVIVVVRPVVKIRLKWETSLWKKAIRLSWPIALSTLFNLVYLRGDVLVLGVVRPAEVGDYGLAYKFIDVLTNVPVLFMGLLLPKLGYDWESGDKEAFERHLQHAFDFLAMSALPLLFGAQMLSIPFLTWISGEKFRSAGLVLQILVFAVLFVFFNSLYGHAVVAVKRQRQAIAGYAVTAVLAVVGYLLFVPHFGMWGAAAVTLFSEAGIAFWTYFIVWKDTHHRPHFSVARKALLASVGMAAVLWFLPPSLHVFFQIVIGIATYGVFLWMLGGINHQMIRTLFVRSV